MSGIPLRSLCTLAAAALLAACGSNPIVRWEPESDLQAGPGDDALDQARREARGLKREYHRRAEAFVGQRQLLNDSLLGLGVLTLGLATGKAHRDAYTVTAGAGGAAFLFGNTNLQQAQLDALQSGIGAVNCALLVVSPLAVGQTGLESVGARASALKDPLARLAEHLARVEALAAQPAGLPAELLALAGQRAAAARQALAAAQAANDTAAELAPTVRSAAVGLRTSLDRIHERVNLELARAQADKTAVRDALQDLAGLVNGFGLKAAGLTGLVGTPAPGGPAPQSARDGEAPPADPALAKAAEDKAQQRAQELTAALTAMAKAQSAVEYHAGPLARELTRYQASDQRAAFEACELKVAGSTLAVDRAALSFTADAAEAQSKTVTVTGGVKPYDARLRDAPSGGVEVLRPLSGESSVEIRVPKGTAARELTVLISDAGPVRQERLVTVSIAAAVAPTPQGQRDGGPAAALRSAFMQLQRDDVFTAAVPPHGHRYKVLNTTISADGSVTRVALSCQRGKGTGRDADGKVKDALLAKAGRPAAGWDKDRTLMLLEGAPECRS